MTDSNQSKLALFGGEPVLTKPWPVWPRADKNTEKILKDVLYSGRWAISGCYTGNKPYERQFAEAFAKFHDVPFCVPTSSGSTALTIAIQALKIGPGKEVLVPGLTWVACASSVFAVGAIPVLVDINPESLCMSLEAARKAITKNTAAIMLVHLYCRVADIDGFLNLSEEMGIPIIEDCSQAHGAIWKGKRVGTFGKIGVFSMQQTKVLTCGEGGATITKDKDLYEKMQQFRADGRLYRDKHVPVGQMELEEAGDVQGRNFCLSEFHSAILLDRLQYLDEENKIREQNAAHLNSMLDEVEYVKPLKPSPNTNLASYYQYCIQLDLSMFDKMSIEEVAHELTKELGILIKPVYNPLNANILCNLPIEVWSRSHLPNAHRVRKECLTIPHEVLLAPSREITKIWSALLKVKSEFSIALNDPTVRKYY